MIDLALPTLAFTAALAWVGVQVLCHPRFRHSISMQSEDAVGRSHHVDIDTTMSTRLWVAICSIPLLRLLVRRLLIPIAVMPEVFRAIAFGILGAMLGFLIGLSIVASVTRPIDYDIVYTGSVINVFLASIAWLAIIFHRQIDTVGLEAIQDSFRSFADVPGAFRRPQTSGADEPPDKPGGPVMSGQVTLSEIARRGKNIYQSNLAAMLEPRFSGKYVRINTETGEYVIGASPVEALDLFRQKYPNAPSWGTQIGCPTHV